MILLLMPGKKRKIFRGLHGTLQWEPLWAIFYVILEPVKMITAIRLVTGGSTNQMGIVGYKRQMCLKQR